MDSQLGNLGCRLLKKIELGYFRAVPLEPRGQGCGRPAQAIHRFDGHETMSDVGQGVSGSKALDFRLLIRSTKRVQAAPSTGWELK